MGSRDGQHVAEAQGIEIRHGGIRVDAVGLVHHQIGGLGQLAQLHGNLLIGGGQAGPTVDQEQHQVRLTYRQQ